MFRYLSKATIGVVGYVIQYGCITHCTFEYIGDFVICSGPSMEPTLYSNNILITERITPRLYRIQRGDIIIAKCPTNPTQHICKRVIGLPGDKIRTTYAEAPIYLISDQKFKQKRNVQDKDNNINDSRSNHKSIDIKTAETEVDDMKKTILIPLETMKKLYPAEIIVPRGHVWIEGDNSENSADSRYYGSIPQGLIKSRAVCRLWPFNEIKMLI